MPIGVPNEGTKSIKPSKAMGVLIRQAPRASHLHGGPGPGVRWIVLNGGQAQHSDASARLHAIEPFAFEEPVRRILATSSSRQGRRRLVS